MLRSQLRALVVRVFIVVAFLSAVYGATALQGKAGSSGRPLNLVAIGDSLPYGQRDCGFCPTFVDLFGKALSGAVGRPVKVSNLSEHTGINSSDLRTELATDKPLRSAVARADAITVTIGHNDPPWNRSDDVCDGRGGYPDADWAKYDDACLAATAKVYGDSLDAILRELRRLRSGKPTLIRVTSDYNDLLGDPQVPTAATPTAKRFFDTYSVLTCRLAQKYKAVCIDTYHAFNGPNGTRDAGPLLASDHTHPNPAGHRLIARLLTRAGYAPFHK